MPNLLEVGRIGRPHGIKGDVFVDLTTDRHERVAVGSKLQARGTWLTVVQASPVNGRFRVHFEGIDDRTAAEGLTGLHLLAEPMEVPDMFWIHELFGASVVEVNGTDRGRCVSVIENPASDILELDSGALVPLTFVVSVEGIGNDGRITIDPPDGLFDFD